MSATAGRARISLLGLMVVVVALLLAVEGGFSPAAAIDRWVGNVTIQGIPFQFTVLINPGVSASWEWRFGGTQVASGFLEATVSGSSVRGTLFVTGGAIFQPGVCCAPCGFSGTIAGNTAQGTADPISCGGDATWFLAKQ